MRERRLSETQMGILMVMGLGAAELTRAAAGILNAGGSVGGFLAPIIMPFAAATTKAVFGKDVDA